MAFKHVLEFLHGLAQLGHLKAQGGVVLAKGGIVGPQRLVFRLSGHQSVLREDRVRLHP